MKLFWILIFTTLSIPLFSQPDLTGLWKGILTQNNGGYRSEYKFELYLRQDGKKITGRSYVSVDDIHAELIIEGEWISNKMIRWKEVKFIESTELVNMEWCFKQAVMEVKGSGLSRRLEGPWQGFTEMGPCIPGEIRLQFVEPQA